MKTFFLFVIALGPILAGCGGGLDMTMKPSKGFKVKSSMEVESNGFDPSSLRLKIERALFKNGIDIQSRSFTPAKDAFKSNSKNRASSLTSGNTTDSVSAGLSTANGPGEDSEYLLEFTYKYDYTFSGTVVTDFSATVFKAGEIVGMISYHGSGTTADELARSVGATLAHGLK